MSTHYETLGVTPNASKEEIIRAHRKLYITWHPDRAPVGSRETHEQKCKLINGAFQILSDPSKRK